MKSKKALTFGIKRELAEYRAQSTIGVGCHAGKMRTSRLAIAGSRATHIGKLAIPAPSSTSCRSRNGSPVATWNFRSGVTVFLPFGKGPLLRAKAAVRSKIRRLGRQSLFLHILATREESENYARISAYSPG